jgi:phosphinothricin acetyltransferase
MADIRPARQSDLEGLNDLYNHYVRTSACTFDIEEISIDVRRKWFESFGGRYKLLVAVDTDRVVGYSHTKPFRPKEAYEPSVESTVYVDHAEMGRGLGKRLYEGLFAAIAGEDIHRVYAGITMPNPASVALHESFGFRQVALFTEQGRKFGKYWDVAWFEKEM